MSRENILYKIHPVAFRLFESPAVQKEDHPIGVVFFLVTRWRFELQTHCLKGNCSAN